MGKRIYRIQKKREGGGGGIMTFKDKEPEIREWLDQNIGERTFFRKYWIYKEEIKLNFWNWYENLVYPTIKLKDNILIKPDLEKIYLKEKMFFDELYKFLEELGFKEGE